MEEIVKYVQSWLEVIRQGQEVSGHAFFSGFPISQKNKSKEVDRLYYALLFIASYAVDKSEKSFQYLSPLSQPHLIGSYKDKNLHWNLYSAIKAFEP